MTVGQIAIRQEVRQILNEAGINKNTLKDMVKEIVREETIKACHQAVSETNTDSIINSYIKSEVRSGVRNIVSDEVRRECANIFRGMKVSIELKDGDKTTSTIGFIKE